MPCKPKLAGAKPNFFMQGCEQGCDGVFKKKQHGPGFETVKLDCKNVTRAGVSGGELLLGEQKCVCVLPCPEGDDVCKLDFGFKPDGSTPSNAKARAAKPSSRRQTRTTLHTASAGLLWIILLGTQSSVLRLDHKG